MELNLPSLLESYQLLREDPNLAAAAAEQVRDLTVIHLNEDFLLVIAVDSDGAIGPKPGDVVRVDGKVAGRMAVRVPLMEILACGATPIAAFDSLAVEMNPTGKSIIEGIRQELISTGMPKTFPLSGSTEDNISTNQTGIGVTILGIVHKRDFRPGSSRPSDLLLCLGIPKSGPQDTVTVDDPSIATGADILKMRHIEGVHDILPIGSKGILYEAGELAKTAGLAAAIDPEERLDMKKSAGPSTCFILSADAATFHKVKTQSTLPVHRIGQLVKKQ